MNTPRLHADLIKAWADGAQIQMFYHNKWNDVPNPIWDDKFPLRVKPLPVSSMAGDEAYGIYYKTVTGHEPPTYSTTIEVAKGMKAIADAAVARYVQEAASVVQPS